MTTNDFQQEKIPEYYKTMARDGFTPHEILAAARRQMISDYWGDRTRDADEPTEIHITSEVNTK